MRLLVLASPLIAGACVSTATSIVKAPFQVAGKAVDLATTSPSERDEKYVRAQRKAAEREDRERHDWAKRCDGHPDRDGCDAYHGFIARERR